ncbi:hypothetical protein SK571_42935 [Lentzea sp. BCCO 10_0798]|uniref:Secreted protein n=1 Tax=Lentzea kristufekii TaxID=3095430 RepID=A0ABU4U7Y9_9PSEU|nr:hypothetical protein [Lentzea sp. BCCO 10_0798]MDX8056172.1 hypothetical protein [Lentzea sp. BCCO 10_0798]
MSIRTRLAAGILAAAAASGMTAGLAPVAAASTGNVPNVTEERSEKWRGLREGPLSSGSECSDRARRWMEKTRIFHHCRHSDGSFGLPEGWYVFELV